MAGFASGGSLCSGGLAHPGCLELLRRGIEPAVGQTYLRRSYEILFWITFPVMSGLKTDMHKGREPGGRPEGNNAVPHCRACVRVSEEGVTRSLLPAFGKDA